MYALFSSEQLATKISDTLQKLADSKDPLLNSFAINVSNYLKGIDERTWSSTEECKALIKNNLVDTLWNWNIQHNDCLQIFPDAVPKDEVFEAEGNGDIGVGPIPILFKFLTCVDHTMSIIYCNGPEYNEPAKNVVQKALKTTDSEIVFLHINYRKGGDKTTLQELTIMEGAKLQSVVAGQNKYHVIAISLCEDPAFIYDNMASHLQIMNEQIFIDAEEILLIYLKD